MGKIFNDTFFRFLLGFVLILGASFAVTFAVDYYAESQLARPVAPAAAVLEFIGGDSARESDQQ